MTVPELRSDWLQEISSHIYMRCYIAIYSHVTVPELWSDLHMEISPHRTNYLAQVHHTLFPLQGWGVETRLSGMRISKFHMWCCGIFSDVILDRIYTVPCFFISFITSVWAMVFIEDRQQWNWCFVCWLSVCLHNCSHKSLGHYWLLEANPPFPSAVTQHSFIDCQSVSNRFHPFRSRIANDGMHVLAVSVSACMTALSNAHTSLDCHRWLEAGRSTLVYHACLLGHVATECIGGHDWM